MRGAALGHEDRISATLDVWLPATPDAPARARAAVAAWLGQAARGDGPSVDDALLMISELVSNCLRHAHIDRDEPLHLQGSLASDAVRFEVWDAGTEGAITARPGNELGGFGLSLVSHLARDWGVDRDAQGTTVWLELSTPTDSTP